MAIGWIEIRVRLFKSKVVGIVIDSAHTRAPRSITLSKVLNSSSTPTNIYEPAAHHLGFVRSGSLNLTTQAGLFRNGGYAGVYWPSSVAISDQDRAYYLQIITGVKPSQGPSDRGLAFSLRCLSADLEG